MFETEDPGCDLSPNRDITLLEISLLGFTPQYFKLNKTDQHFSPALLNTFFSSQFIDNPVGDLKSSLMMHH